MKTKPQQPSFFTQGQDLPLFSQTAPRAGQAPFIPRPVATQPLLPVTCTACRDTGNIGGRRCWCGGGQWRAGRG